MLDTALLMARTAASLRWQQWVYRPVRRAQAHLPVRVRKRADPHPQLQARFGPAVLAWGVSDPDRSLATADAVLRAEFRFLNHSEYLPRIDWSRRYVSHLWSYNLHYFDYAVDLACAWRTTADRRYVQCLAELTRSWIDGNPVGSGDGWQPYALSLRTVNWIYALLLLEDALDRSDREILLGSIAAQLDVLDRRLELHILGNHLQKNLKALLIGGLCFTGTAAARWLRRGSRMLWREILEQVLPDGTHFERSPMYHAIALGDLLEVMSLADAAAFPVPDDVRERIRAMVSATGTLIRPDGRAHLFNDAAHGIAPRRAWIDHMARLTLDTAVPSPIGVVELPDAGYFGIVDRGGDRLLIDCGEIGPAYQPGHSHCDLLSFELDLAGVPVVVDPGVHGYDGDRFREFVRSTRAHNTVSVDGRDQAEIWATFRVARRPRPLSASHTVGPGGEYLFSGSYAPYYDRNVHHHRSIVRRAGEWCVTDHVDGAVGSRLDSFLHLDPQFSVRQDGEQWIASAQHLRIEIVPFGADAVSIHSGEESPMQGWYCPEFGVAVAAPVLRLTINDNDGRDFGYTIRRVVE